MAAQQNDQQVVAGTQLPAEFKDIEAQLAALKEQYSVVPDCSTKDGYKEAKQAIQALTKMRTGTDKARLAITDPLRERVKQINDFAKALVGEVERLEGPIRDAKKEVDEEIQRKNEARKNKIREGIERDITVYVDTAVGLGQADIMQMVNELRALDVAIYGELEKEADDERQRVIGILSTMALDAMQKPVEVTPAEHDYSPNVDMGSGAGRAVAPTLPDEKVEADAWDQALDDLQAQAGLTEEQSENVMQAIIAGDIRGLEFNI